MKEKPFRAIYSGYASLVIDDFNHVFLSILSRHLWPCNITFCGDTEERPKGVLKECFKMGWVVFLINSRIDNRPLFFFQRGIARR